MVKYKESEYKYAVRRHDVRGGGTTIHTKHMTKKNAKKSLGSLKSGGRKGYIVKL